MKELHIDTQMMMMVYFARDAPDRRFSFVIDIFLFDQLSIVPFILRSDSSITVTTLSINIY